MRDVWTSMALRGGSSGNAGKLAATYYTADYYGQAAGEWRGKLAQELGLTGAIGDGDKRLVEVLAGKLHGKPLTVRGKAVEITAYDFTFSVPKSVSILAEYDPRIAEAIRESAREAFDDLERFAARRVRNGVSHETKATAITGNVLGGLFFHDTSREGDPQQHVHCVLANATRGADGRIYALERLEMCRNIEFLGRAGEARLARRLTDLGYQIETATNQRGQIKGWRIKGVSADIEEKFSLGRQRVQAAVESELARRRGLLRDRLRVAPAKPVEEYLAELGEKRWSDLSAKTLSPGEIEVLSRQTRPEKPQWEEWQRAEWFESRLTRDQHKAHHILVAEAQIRSETGERQEAAPEAWERGLERVFERASVATGSRIAADILRHDPLVDPAELERRLRELVRLRDEALPLCGSFTTRKTLEREKAILSLVSDGRSLPALAPGARIDKSLGDDQAKALRAILESRSPAFVLTGDAGSGKTKTMQALRDVLRERGIAVEFLSPTKSGVAAMAGEGIDARTVQSFVMSGPRKGTRLLVVDEAGLMGVRSGLAVLSMAKESGARVLFVGDAKQNLPIETGDFLRLLQDHSRVDQARLSEVRRQRNPALKAEVAMLAAGEVAAGLTSLRSRGCVVEKDDYLQEAAKRYLDARAKGENVVLVAKTWAEIDRATETIRDRLREEGRIGEGVERRAIRSYGWTESERRDLSRYKPGMGVSIGGEAREVVEVSNGKLRLDDGREVDPKHDRVAPGELRKIEIAAGDEILIRENRKGSESQSPLVNNERIRVAAVEQDGTIVASDGRRIEASFGMVEHGYARTCYSVQGPSFDRAIVAVGDGKSWSDNELYVGVSRARHAVEIVTPSAESLVESRGGWAKRELVHDLHRRIAPRELLTRADVLHQTQRGLRAVEQPAAQRLARAQSWARDRLARADRQQKVSTKNYRRGRGASPRPQVERQKTLVRRTERITKDHSTGQEKKQLVAVERLVATRRAKPAPAAIRDAGRDQGLGQDEGYGIGF